MVFFFYIVVSAAIVAAGYFPFRKASDKAKFYYLLTLSFINLAVHFLKMLLPEYQADYPMSWRKYSFENIYAICCERADLSVRYDEQKRHGERLRGIPRNDRGSGMKNYRLRKRRAK